MKKKISREKLLVLFFLSIPLSVVIYSIWPSLVNQGYMYGRDAGGHLLRANYWARALFLHGHITGWFPLWYGGFNLYQTYPVLVYYPLGILSIVIEEQLALKIVCGLLWMGLIPSAYFLLKKFGMPSRLAAIGASLFIFLNSELSVGHLAVFLEGLLPNCLGFICAVLFIGFFKSALSQRNLKMRDIICSGVFLGCVVLAHPFCAYWAVSAAILLTILELVFAHNISQISVLKRFTAVFLIGMALSAYWWIPFSMNLEEMARTEPFFISSRETVLKRLIVMQDNGNWVPNILAGMGTIYLLWIKSWRELLFFLGMAGLSMLWSMGFVIPYQPFGDIIHSSQRVRFEGFYFWTIWALAAYSLPCVWYVSRRFVPLKYGTWVRFFWGVLILIYLPLMHGSFRTGYVYPYLNDSVLRVRDLGYFLNKTLKNGEFVITEDNWAGITTYGSLHFLHHNLGLLSDKVWDLSGGLPEGTRASQSVFELTRHMDNKTLVTDSRELFEKRGIRFIVTTQGKTCRVLKAIPWLEWVWVGLGNEKVDSVDPQKIQRDYLSVFELKNYKNRFGFSPEMSSLVTDINYRSPGVYHVKFLQPTPIPVGTTMAVSFHPWFKLYAGGKVCPINPGNFNEIKVSADIPAVSELTLEFQQHALSRWSGWLSLVVWFLCIFILVFWSRILSIFQNMKARTFGD